jgi:squalene-hopene/tetraprenyl-beta-curcumene cyclase
MKTMCIGFLAFFVSGIWIAFGAPPDLLLKAPSSQSDISLQKEVEHAIDQGLAWIVKRQDPGGFWTTADHPAISALVLTACMGDPSKRYADSEPVKKGYTFLLKCVHPDGGIYQKGLLNYNTSVAMMALLAANRGEYDPVLRNARNFVIGQQANFGERELPDRAFDGGIGYGDKNDRSDLSNTVFALEALYHSKHLIKGKELADAKDLNWPAVIQFVQRCQNLPSYNKQPWASDAPADKGGFVYSPNESKVPSEDKSSGKQSLRSYGSMSYAGLLSYIYADLKRDDPRVAAVYDWLRRNYTLEENPGMGEQGRYYYYQTMAKALTAYGLSELELADGRKVKWRKELALKLINLQKADGSWVNANARWWENDPVLVTAYSLIALEIVHRGL